VEQSRYLARRRECSVGVHAFLPGRNRICGSRLDPTRGWRVGRGIGPWSQCPVQAANGADGNRRRTSRVLHLSFVKSREIQQ
jgi:hypothetical protein